MKTIINVWTNKGSINGVEFDKEFNEVDYDDIVNAVVSRFGIEKDVIVKGWCTAE